MIQLKYHPEPIAYIIKPYWYFMRRSKQLYYQIEITEKKTMVAKSIQSSLRSESKHFFLHCFF